jgi:hypothetical protein
VSLGILGAYIGRIYEETKLRPKFIVEKAFGFEDSGDLIAGDTSAGNQET